MAALDMSRGTITGIGILAVVILVLFSAFFASSEIAIFSLADHRIATLVEDGVAGAKTLSTLKSDPRRLLVTILVGNNVANIGMSAITTGLLGLYFDPGQSVLIATFGVTSIVLLFGESAPKSYGVEHSESWALRIARPLRYTQQLMYPLVAVFDVLTDAINGLMGNERDLERAYVTRSEVREVITAGQRAGVFTEAEHRMLQRLLRFHNRIVRETMVRRPDVVAVEVDTDIETAIETCLENERNELPVYEGVLDTVVGTVHVRDLTEARFRGDDPSLRSVTRDPYVVPETKDVDELLTELREQRRRMAVVVDEYGTTSGIVTIEDIVEEIIGEVLAEREAPPIRWLDDDTAIVRGELNVHEANEALGTNFPEDGTFETIAGLIMDQTGRLVDEGDRATYDGIDLTAETMANNRLLEVRVDLSSGGRDDSRTAKEA
ncbi:hemolysin family protein [Halorhabdus amylolytica]|uniref:hemolysin family protein n=1 Tax=Halorhabdus amylolytica TaxID=2559573 RepID=UPI0020BE9F62|nr:hemolysin family protein [Halorhabdus amylolytica]